MQPILFHLGSLSVSSFFFSIMIGALAMTFFAKWMAGKEGSDQIAILDMGIIGIIASVLGARIFHILVENPSYYWEQPLRVFYFWQGGFVSLGAFIASSISWVVYFKIRKLDPWRYFDLAAVSVPIIIFFVRTGCLLVGCCYGKPTDFFLHVIFNNPASTAGGHHLGIPLHATQTYFMLNAIVMWAVLWYVYKHRKFYGQVLCSFFIYYGFTRFFIEFLRGDDDRGLWFWNSLSTGQVVMILTFTAGVVLWSVLKDRNKIKGK